MISILKNIGRLFHWNVMFQHWKKLWIILTYLGARLQDWPQLRLIGAELPQEELQGKKHWNPTEPAAVCPEFVNLPPLQTGPVCSRWLINLLKAQLSPVWAHALKHPICSYKKLTKLWNFYNKNWSTLNILFTFWFSWSDSSCIHTSCFPPCVGRRSCLLGNEVNTLESGRSYKSVYWVLVVNKYIILNCTIVSSFFSLVKQKTVQLLDFIPLS